MFSTGPWGKRIPRSEQPVRLYELAFMIRPLALLGSEPRSLFVGCFSAETLRDNQLTGEWQPLGHRGCVSFGLSPDFGGSASMSESTSMRTVGVNIGLVLACTFLLTGCTTVVAQMEPQLVSERFPFVQDGKTSKEDVLLSIGEPDNRYEGGRILTYKRCGYTHLEDQLRLSNTRLSDEKGEALRAAVRCSAELTNTLILVFGPDDLVERHSLVLVK
jgi:hypothetical protein